MFLSGALLMVYNMIMTVRSPTTEPVAPLLAVAVAGE